MGMYCELHFTIVVFLQGSDHSRVVGQVAGSASHVQMNWLATLEHTQEKRISPALSAARNLCAAIISG
jgi:hypothetical protein